MLIFAISQDFQLFLHQTAEDASLSFIFPLMEFQSVAAVVEFLQWGSQATLVFSNTKLSSVDVERCFLLYYKLLTSCNRLEVWCTFNQYIFAGHC